MKLLSDLRIGARQGRKFARIGLALSMFAAAVAVFQGAALVPVHALTNDLHVDVVSADATATPIAEFKYMINVDNTGTTGQRTPAEGCSPASAGYPTSCHWTTTGIQSSAPIYAQGDQDDFNGTISSSLNLPDGRYLISVLADGYKLDGAHFTMPLQDGERVKVQMQPYSPVNFPNLTVLDDFNANNSSNLGSNWSQPNNNIRRRNGEAQNNAANLGNAFWNVAAFGSAQGAALTMTNATVNGNSLILKAHNGTAAGPTDFIRVRYDSGSVFLGTTADGGGTYTNPVTFAALFVSDDTLTAVANDDGSVDVWKTSSFVTTYVGHAAAVPAFAGVSGRIGIQLPSGATVDNFSGGDVAGPAQGLPDATIQAAVFEDISPTNSAPDMPGEHGLPGFRASLNDYLGTLITDVYGSPLCTEYGTQPVDPTAPDVVFTGGNCLSACYVVANGLDVGIVPPNSVGVCPDDAGDPALLMSPTPANQDPPDIRYVNPANLGPADTPLPATAEIEGKVIVPHLGTNRYALSVVPPNGSGYVQTTTLEGNHDWDAWVMEGATGLDTEFTVGGEPFPAIIFGYVKESTPGGLGGTTGTIKGVVDAVKVYVPAVGGLPNNAGAIWGGVSGSKIDHPIEKPYLALSDLNNGDTAIWIGRGNADGTFSIPNVPDGSYTLSWWDEPQDYIMDLQNVTVVNGEVVDMGVLPMQDWWTQYDGYVFNDTNRNGKMDWTDANHNGCPDGGVEGEAGVPNYTLTMRKRENSLMDRGTTTVGTDACGHYYFESGYPMTQWLVMEAYNDLYYTTGVTYQADNQPSPTTVIGHGVDVSTLPIIGLSGHMDWGVHAYDPTGANGIDPKNGGIVGTVSYDTTRNELDPRYAAVEDWQPGVSGIPVKLYAPVDCPGDGSVPCDPTDTYQLDPTDGSYLKGKLLNTYVTETWAMPGAAGDQQQCIPRDVNGDPLAYPAGQMITNNPADCLEAPLMGVQYGPYATAQGTADANFGATVDGNYGFGDGCFNGTLDETDPANPVCVGGAFETLPGGADYLVHVEVPNDAAHAADPVGTAPQYKFTREEDINIANGDPWVPQAPPPACVGALHTVDVAGAGTDGYPATVLPGGISGVNVAASTPTDNPGLLDIGGSPYEGAAKPSCDTKLVPLADGKSIVPTFNVYTDVPVPGRFWGLVVDDLNFSTNKQQVNYGEKAGVPFAPVGIYDYTNRLVYTVESDYGGLFDVLMPSTNRISCPTPSGVCASLYRFVGNDPGVPGALNPNYNPMYRTIAAEFEAFPGLIVPADLAPTQVGVNVQLPGGQAMTPVTCPQDSVTPQLFAVNRPYVLSSAEGNARRITINGLGFGATPGAGSVTLSAGATTRTLQVVSWSNTRIVVAVPAIGTSVTTIPGGAYQLKIRASNNRETVNGLTIHVLGSGYNPTVYEVGPATNPNYSRSKVRNGLWFTPANTLPLVADHSIQHAIDAATNSTSSTNLVVVYPGLATTDTRMNPNGSYYENLIISRPVKLQGVGPGGFQGATKVAGTIIDGGAFAGDGPVATDWLNRIDALTWAGNQTVNDGAIISIYADSEGRFSTSTNARVASIDGLDLRGGDQQGFPTNINAIGGLPTGLPGTIVTQGGAVFANAYASNLQITNNTVQNNGGGYGTIRIGTPGVGDNHNDNVRIANNRIIANGGTNLAGAIGLFAGSNGYEVASNEICGNFSAEYGGAISHFGLSNVTVSGSSTGTPKIHDNKIWFNQSYDEGAGIMIAGELPADMTAPYGSANGAKGSGAVDVYNNLIQANLANDDGGGLRLLMVGNFPINVYDNMIVNNVSTHEGGGVALDDAPNVRFYNNTVMKNQTTATAITSDGSAAPAGLSTAKNSDQLQGTLPAGSPVFSNPLLFNNIFWDNRAGSVDSLTKTVIGLGLAGDATPINHWDVGVAGTAFQLSPTNSVLQSETTNHNDVVSSLTNKVDQDPLVVSSYNTGLAFDAWRTNINFIGATLVSADLSPGALGDYHLIGTSSPAYDAGAASKAVLSYQQPAAPTPYQATGTSTLNAPTTDIDNQARPAFVGFDSGADEFPGLTADLSITKTDGVTTVQPGNAVHYTITVANAGPETANGATVTDTVPAALTGVTWTCTAAAGSSCGAASGSGNISTTVNLPSGGSATYTVNGTVAANASGSLANTASVATAGGTSDPVAGNNTATDTDSIILPTDLSITKTDGASIVSRGGPVRYTIVVTNAGPNAVTGATVNDTFPTALSGTINWTCATTGGATCGGGGGNGTINRTVNMPVGSTITFATTGGSVSTSTPATSLVNTATIAAPAGILDTNPANNSATDTDTINGVHVGDLDWTSANTSGTLWSASVTITVHDANHNPVAGVAVTGAWVTFAGSGSGSCTTVAVTGQCTVTRTGLSRTSNASVAYAVLLLAHAPDGYQITLNHDPDSGLQASNGITITANRP